MKNLIMQTTFLKEIDKVKGVLRASLALGERQENDAEHSWHMAITAMTLKPHFKEELSMEKVLKMILLHDVVEIYAGDNPCYGKPNPNKFQEEYESAQKIFSFLPKEQYDEFISLWLEFEEESTAEARFAVCCDKIQGFIQNLESDGHTWKLYSVQEYKVIDRLLSVKESMPEFFESFILPEISSYKKRGIILEDTL